MQNLCKSYSSSAYIDVGAARIAFLWRKTVQKLVLQGVHTCTDCSNSIFVAQNRAKRAILTGRTYSTDFARKEYIAHIVHIARMDVQWVAL